LIEPKERAKLRRFFNNKKDLKHNWLENVAIRVEGKMVPWEEKRAKLLSLMDEMTYKQLWIADALLLIRSFKINLKEESEAVKQLTLRPSFINQNI